jgi:hypothetical protein
MAGVIIIVAGGQNGDGTAERGLRGDGCFGGQIAASFYHESGHIN